MITHYDMATGEIVGEGEIPTQLVEAPVYAAVELRLETVEDAVAREKQFLNTTQHSALMQIPVATLLADY